MQLCNTANKVHGVSVAVRTVMGFEFLEPCWPHFSVNEKFMNGHSLAPSVGSESERVVHSQCHFLILSCLE